MVEVTKTTIQDGKTVDHSRKVKKIKIRPFVTDTATVSIKYGLTIPTVEYGGARVDVFISCPCYKEEIVDVFEMVQGLADRLIDIEADKIEPEEEDA
jgi:hypothetical protein